MQRPRGPWGLVAAVALLAFAPAAALGADLGGNLSGNGPPRWEQGNVTGGATAVVALPGGGFAAGGSSVGEWVESGSTIVEIVPPQAYVAAYDDEGKPSWFHVVDDGVFDLVGALAAAPDGRLYAVGAHRGTGQEVWGWLRAFEADGRLAWARNLSEPSVDGTELRGVFLDGDTVVAVGSAVRKAGSGALAMPFLVRLGADGAERERRILEDLWGVHVVGAAPGPVPGSVLLAGANPVSGEGCLVRVDGSAVAWKSCDRDAAQYMTAVSARGGGAAGALGVGYRDGVDTHAVARWVGGTGAAETTRHYDEAQFNARFAAVGVLPLADGGAAVVVANLTTAPLVPVVGFAEAALAGDLGGEATTVLLRYGPDGTLAASQELQRLGTLMPFAAAPSGDGGVLVAGLTADPTAQDYHPFVLRAELP